MVRREGEDVGSPVNATIAAVEFPDGVVIGDEEADLAGGGIVGEQLRQSLADGVGQPLGVGQVGNGVIGR